MVARYPAIALDHDERFLAEIYARMAALGRFGIGSIPAGQGGAGMDTPAYASAMEELGRRRRPVGATPATN